MLGWDTRIALAFAAEELFLAAQALTTDLISREHGLLEAHRHLRGLLEHERALPSEIGTRLRSLDLSYSQREESRANDKAGDDALTAATMAVLENIRDIVQERLPHLFKTGEPIKVTGIYHVNHVAHSLPLECTLIEGQTFPRCCKCDEAIEFECIAVAPQWESGPTRTIILYELPEFPADAAGK